MKFETPALIGRSFFLQEIHQTILYHIINIDFFICFRESYIFAENLKK